MMTTTYQHDYVPPQTKRYKFMQMKNLNAADREREECQCIEDVRVEPPRAALENCGGMEWTGVAPMGRLIDPRIIPTRLSPEQIENLADDQQNDCFKAQPNRFLKILRTVYPDLYERLKLMPKDELNRRLERERLFTTYQIDYCNVNEYPEGIYESLQDSDETSKMNKNKLLQHQGPCAEFRANIMSELENEGTDGAFKLNDPCETAYKPFRISFTDSSRFIASGNNSHWRSNVFSKRPNFSEYMDTINRNGCVIMRNNIHNHSKCIPGKHCRHILLRMCSDLKS